MNRDAKYKCTVHAGNEVFEQWIVVGKTQGAEHAYIEVHDEDGHRGVASLDLEGLKALRGAIDDLLNLCDDSEE